MTDGEIKKLIEDTVKATVAEYKRAGLLAQGQSAVYADAAEMIRQYYASAKKDAAITYAIQGKRFDPYYPIIDLYFGAGWTNEAIAEKLGVDITTVARNKRRLCLEIYNELI